MIVQSLITGIRTLRSRRLTARDALRALKSRQIRISHSNGFKTFGYCQQLHRRIVEVGNSRIGIVYADAICAPGKGPRETLAIEFYTLGGKKGFFFAEFKKNQLVYLRHKRRGKTMDFDASTSVPLITILEATREAARVTIT